MTEEKEVSRECPDCNGETTPSDLAHCDSCQHCSSCCESEECSCCGSSDYEHHD